MDKPSKKFIIASVVLLVLISVIILFLRFPLVYPSYDDLALHLVSGGYLWTLFGGPDVMPMNIATYYYPTVQIIYSLFLNLVGIRMTIFLYFSLCSVWMILLYLRFLKLVKTDIQKWILFYVFLFLITYPPLMGTHGTLMTDFIALTVSLEALYQFISNKKNKTVGVILIIVLAMIKQSTFLFTIPIFAYFTVKERKKVNGKRILVVLVLAALFPYLSFRETGNPLFGLYNNIFKSSLYSLTAFHDGRWGPTSLVQIFTWPVMGQFTSRFDETVVSTYTKIIFSWMMALPYLIGIFFFLFRRKIKYLMIVLSFLLWSFLSGYSRYCIPVIALSLIILVVDVSLPKVRLRKPIYIVLTIVLFMLSLSSLKVDFAFRPFPSVRTTENNSLFLKIYGIGIKNIFKDTPQAIAHNVSRDFMGYEGIISIYRGPVTFYSYLGHLLGLPVTNGFTKMEYKKIIHDKKISSHLKENLQATYNMKQILVVVDRSDESLVRNLYILPTFSCLYGGPASRSSLLQGGSLDSLLLYICKKR